MTVDPRTIARAERLAAKRHPLLEHWDVPSKVFLDAARSDYHYKHHISHLESIYAHHHWVVGNIPNPPIPSRSYGTSGLREQIVDQIEAEENVARREREWIDNFQTHQALNKTVGASDRRKPRSTTVGGATRQQTISAGLDQTNFRGGVEEEPPLEHDVMHISRRTRDDSLTAIEQSMLGVYSLTPAQDTLFKQFVEMISELDPFDRANLLADAAVEAAELDNIEGYCGTEATS